MLPSKGAYKQLQPKHTQLLHPSLSHNAPTNNLLPASLPQRILFLHNSHPPSRPARAGSCAGVGADTLQGQYARPEWIESLLNHLGLERGEWRISEEGTGTYNEESGGREGVVGGQCFVGEKKKKK